MRAKRGEVARIIRQIPRAAAGDLPLARDLAQALLVRIGFALLGRIRAAFVAKSRGETDDCGLKWASLARSTVAYSRRHPGVLWPGKKRAPYRPSWMLTDKQRRRWWQLNAIGGPAYAWRIVKAEGGKTLIGEYGDTQVDVLRDTGLLLNSLSPGVAAGPDPQRVEHQVFRLEKGEVYVGTNRKWAAAHHAGIPGRLPQRRLWAEPRDWPASWWGDMAAQAREGIVEITLFLLGRRAA